MLAWFGVPDTHSDTHSHTPILAGGSPVALGDIELKWARGNEWREIINGRKYTATWTGVSIRLENWTNDKEEENKYVGESNVDTTNYQDFVPTSLDSCDHLGAQHFHRSQQNRFLEKNHGSSTSRLQLLISQKYPNEKPSGKEERNGGEATEGKKVLDGEWYSKPRTRSLQLQPAGESLAERGRAKERWKDGGKEGKREEYITNRKQTADRQQTADVETDRQTDMQTDSRQTADVQTDMQTCRQTDRQTDVETDMQTDSRQQTCRQTCRQTDGQTDVETDGLADTLPLQPRNNTRHPLSLSL
ncbi:hypothetical protein FQN60_009205 [Etheostoma spectabile]|uniref:Uncharacterized protein n=1 Tax=Etheostoma spectabile TaxID=54343 RepID=A0A5J5CCX9_9PERO|nr:hypothetical protein FQN60_009205 [Etheostoma spectabile]